MIVSPKETEKGPKEIWKSSSQAATQRLQNRKSDTVIKRAVTLIFYFIIKSSLVIFS